MIFSHFHHSFDYKPLLILYYVFAVIATNLFAAASVAVALFRHMGLGSVLGLLVAGVVVGPHSPGPLSPLTWTTCGISLNWGWCCCS